MFFLPFSVASTALNMCLYHSKDPRDPNRTLKIDHVSSETRDLWNRSLRGRLPPPLVTNVPYRKGQTVSEIT